MSVYRITWIDSAKVIAGVLMILDHGLLYFGQETSWIRYSITRCVEPLYVFCFAYLQSDSRRGLSPKRWRQLAMAAVIETAIHSHREGVLYFGILANLTSFGWLVGILRRMSTPWLIAVAVITSVAAVIPMHGSTFYVDYGPSLLASQFSFAILASRQSGLLAITLATSWCAALVTCGVVVGIGYPLSSTVWTVVVGHPIAAASILGCSKHLRAHLGSLGSAIVSHPLKFYIGHLGVMHLIEVL
jgi:hypothetical protein